MPRIVPLPESVRALLGHNTHPGLMLDKYVESWDADAPAKKLSEAVQRPAVDAVAALSRKEPDGLRLADLLARRSRLLDSLGAARLSGTTTGPLTLHLARASALENAGICLHPVYGFVHLPGSGLKGMARAYAETVWLPTRPDGRTAWGQIEAVFGWAPGCDIIGKDERGRPRLKPWRPGTAKSHGEGDAASAGSVVFHDAWPEKWPPLIVDILNSHHNGYYQKSEPPGDWDDPVPVYFLAVPAGQMFSFAVSRRRDDVPEEHFALAGQWLAGALMHLGAGAKTATGYGAFRLEQATEHAAQASVCDDSATWKAACANGTREECEVTLELVTPAFLAGASQTVEDCDLRPATLRGLLRWWWRTLHVGFVSTADLKKMEAAVWGDTAAGGAIRVTVEATAPVTPLRFDRPSIARQNQLPSPPNQKTTQGLTYHSFGMDDNKTEGGEKRHVQRWYLAPGTRWRVRMLARPGHMLAAPVRAAIVLDQARAALALLCRFGGVGAKSRKGFGSFADAPKLAPMSLVACRQSAVAFREEVGLGKPKFDPRYAKSFCLEEVLPWEEIPLGWTNYWLALDQVADVAQRFAQQYKHRLEKKALGLPRNMRPPVNGQFRAGRHVNKDRHASPAWYHFGRDGNGNLVLRVTAFPAKELPDEQASRRFLGELLDFLRGEVPRRAKEHAERGKKPPVNGPGASAGPSGSTAPAPKPAAVKSGDRVKAVLVAEKTKAGGWKARHDGTGLVGPVVNTTDVPAEKQAGDEVELIVISDNPRNASFRYPTTAVAPKPPNPGGGKPPTSGRR
jgi:CRISPR-associated protein Cmr6